MPKFANSPALSHTHSRSLRHSISCLPDRVLQARRLPAWRWQRNSHTLSARFPWDKARMDLPDSVQAANHSAIAAAPVWRMALCHIVRAFCRRRPGDHQCLCRSASGCRYQERWCRPSRHLFHAGRRFSGRSSDRSWGHFPRPVCGGLCPGLDHHGLPWMCLSSYRASKASP